MWPLLAGYDRPDGKRSYPIAAMVANLAKPTPEKPALMRHDDVVTFFHEMGHVFHGLLSNTKFARFHGTRYIHSLELRKVLRFFILASHGTLLKRHHRCWRTGWSIPFHKIIPPSNRTTGVGNPRFSKRCQVTTRRRNRFRLSSSIKLLRGPPHSQYILRYSYYPCSRYVNVGLFYLRQLFFAKFDLKVHTHKGIVCLIKVMILLTKSIITEEADYTKLWNTLREEVSLVKGGKQCPGQGTFYKYCIVFKRPYLFRHLWTYNWRI